MAEDHPPSPRLASVEEWIAYGLGSGLAPRAPGTAGSAVAALVHWLWIAHWPVWMQWLLVGLGLCIGIWACQRVERKLGQHDAGHIVWDEFVGMWLTLIAGDGSALATVLGFALFRTFDILKPWPIRVLDRRVEGGLGVMIDDVAAGFLAAGVLALIPWGSGWPLSP